MREYLIYEDRPAYSSRVQVRWNAYLTRASAWSEMREWLPATVSHYELYWAESKPAAVAHAKSIWPA